MPSTPGSTACKWLWSPRQSAPRDPGDCMNPPGCIRHIFAPSLHHVSSQGRCTENIVFCKSQRHEQPCVPTLALRCSRKVHREVQDLLCDGTGAMSGPAPSHSISRTSWLTSLRVPAAGHGIHMQGRRMHHCAAQQAPATEHPPQEHPHVRAAPLLLAQLRGAGPATDPIRPPPAASTSARTHRPGRPVAPPRPHGHWRARPRGSQGG